MKPPFRTLFFIVLFTKLGITSAQNSVGINTNTPNSNSVLELVSPESNQGFLIPKLASSQRLAMSSKLTINENGLMVYDRDANLFFYWKDEEWIPGLGALNITPAGGDLDGFYPNPIIRIGAVTEEKIANSAITREKIKDAAISSVKIEDGAVVKSKLEDTGVLPGPYGNPFVTLQLSVDSKGRTVGLSEIEIKVNSSNIEDLSIEAEDIQDGSITISKLNAEDNSDKILAVNENGAIEWISKSNFQSSRLLEHNIFIGSNDNTAVGLPVAGDIELINEGSLAKTQIKENSVTSKKIADNEINDEDLNKSEIPISGFAAATNKVDLGNNKIINVLDPISSQDASTKGYVDRSIATSESNDLDKDATNELNTNAELSGTSIEITDEGGTQSVDLDPVFATDSELSTAISNSESSDLDKDATNELNTALDLDGTTLEITDAGGTLSQNLDDVFATDAQLTASDDADLDKDAANELNTNAELSGTSIEITDSGGIQSVDLDPVFTTDSELSTAISNSESSDLDKDATNELNTALDLDGTTLEITDAGGTLSQNLDDVFATDAQLTASDDADLDKDAMNELNANAELSGTSIEITDAGGTQSVDLDPTFATDSELSTAISNSESSDLDKDATNELNTNAELSGTSIEITDAGGTLSVDLDPVFATDSELSTAISNSESNDLDKDATNELNTNAELSGTSIEITDAGGTQSVDLNPVFATDAQLTASDDADLDKDATNELNTNVQLSGTSVEITDTGGIQSVDLDPAFATDSELSTAISNSESSDLDKDATNELNTNAELSGTSIEITDAGGTQSVDLDPTFATDSELSTAISNSESSDLDKDATNELNTNAELSGTSIEITDAGGTQSVDLDPTFATDIELSTAISNSESSDLDKDATNELNTNAELSGTSIEITDAGGIQSVDLDPAFATDSELSTAISNSESSDLDKDATNELNTDAGLSGTSIEITDAGGTQSVDLDPVFATDSELSTAISNSESNDLDKDAANELNTNVQLSGTSIEITDAGGTQSVDLDPVFATDSELSTAISNSESSDLDKDATNELNTNVQLSGTSIEITDAGGTQSVDLDPVFATDSELSTAISNSESNDLDKDATNELNTNAELSGTSIEITDAGGTQSVDLDPAFATDSELSTAILNSESSDLDKDATNELNTALDLDGTTLEITDAGGTLSQNLDDVFATDAQLTASDDADLDKDATNELNTNAELSGTSIEITDSGGIQSVDLDPAFATDSELSTAISNSESSDLDKDATNELNTALDLDGTTLEITDAGGTLSQNLDDVFATDAQLTASDDADLDKDATNELNANAELSGTSIEITDAGGTQSVDLDPAFATDSELSTAILNSESSDLDKDATNELNTNAELSGTSIEITDAGGIQSVDLDPAFATDSELSTAISNSESNDLDKDATNELNTDAELSGTSIEITDAGGTQSVDLDPVFATDSELSTAISNSESSDLDKDATNELNTNAELSGTSIEITDAGGTQSVDLNPVFATDSELSTAISNSESSDLDKDATNELNTALDLDGTTLEITDAGGTLSQNLGDVFATDAQLTTALQNVLNELNEFKKPIAFEVYLNGSTSYVSSGPIPFNNEIFEDGEDFVLGGSYFSVPRDGNYHFDAQVTIDFDSDALRAISIYVDSDETGSLDGIRVARTLISSETSEVMTIRISKTLKLDEGNRVYIRYEGPTSYIMSGRANTFFSGHIVK